MTPHEEVQNLLRDLKAVLGPKGASAAARLQAGFAAMSERMEILTDEIETLKYAGRLPAIENDQVEGRAPQRLTPKERELLAYLQSCGPRGATYEAILAAMNSDRPVDDWPDRKIVQVWVCKIRAKYFEAQLPNPVRTVWGSGFIYQPQATDCDWRDTYCAELMGGRSKNPTFAPSTRYSTQT